MKKVFFLWEIVGMVLRLMRKIHGKA